jgi:hypothetical protein
MSAMNDHPRWFSPMALKKEHKLSVARSIAKRIAGQAGSTWAPLSSLEWETSPIAQAKSAASSATAASSVDEFAAQVEVGLQISLDDR